MIDALVSTTAFSLQGKEAAFERSGSSSVGFPENSDPRGAYVPNLWKPTCLESSRLIYLLAFPWRKGPIVSTSALHIPIFSCLRFGWDLEGDAYACRLRHLTDERWVVSCQRVCNSLAFWSMTFYKHVAHRYPTIFHIACTKAHCTDVSGERLLW